MGLLHRFLGLAAPDDRNRVRDPDQTQPVHETTRPAAVVATTALACPSCAALLDPAPSRDRLCPRCRQPIVVRRLDGRTALLTRAAVTVFEAERRRKVDERTWSRARQDWLRLARRINASPVRRAKLEAAPVSAEVVGLSRNLYLSAAERAVRTARRERRWGDVERVRREQARALYEEVGAPVPPPNDILRFYREGMTALLRSLEPLARDAELVGSGCCSTCRAEDGKTFRIAAEIRLGRLPHAGCPSGLCGCDWWPALGDQKRSRRHARRTGFGGRS